MPTPWNKYLALPNPEATFEALSRRCRGAYSRQREIIARIIEAKQPKTVACLGAGLMNDIPYDRLIGGGATVHLVDWVPGILEAGVARSIIECGGGEPECLYCTIDTARAGDYCRRFEPPKSPAAKVCEHYAPAPGSPPACVSFEKGRQPHCATEDATGGYADGFAAAVERGLSGAGTWKKALSRASSAAKAALKQHRPLAIADGSVDLVTSALLISQFEHEPYEYFSRLAARGLKPPSPREERRLSPAMNALRQMLLTSQIERHCDEIERILAPGGLCFMSFEAFQYRRKDGAWFLVREMNEALGLIARRFNFNFDLIGEDEVITSSQLAQAPSLIYSFVLTAKARSV